MRTGLIDSFISKCIYNIMTSVRFVVSQNKSMSPSSKTKMTISNSINRPTITNSNSLLPADRFLFLYCRLSSFCWYLCSVQNCLVVSLNLLIFPIIILNDDYNDIYIYIYYQLVSVKWILNVHQELFFKWIFGGGDQSWFFLKA